MFEPLLRRLGTGPLLVAAVAIILTVVFGDLPGEGKYAAVLQDSCHSPAFAALSLIVLTLLQRRFPRLTVRALFVKSATTVFLMLLVGIATEGLQSLLGRDAEFDDVVSDVVGALGACGLWVYTHLRMWPAAPARIGRGVALLTMAATLGFWSTPLLRCADAYWRRHAQFPVVAQFQSKRDLYFVTGNARDIRIVAAPRNANGQEAGATLQASLDSGRWPGVTLSEPQPDWHGYKVLALDLGNPGPTALPLHLRINDHAHNGEFDDRFNTSMLLPPNAETTIRIPLEQIATAPRTRRMDMQRIAALTVFHDGSAPSQVIVMHRIWLE